jgi:hypothetical protein
VLTRLTRACTHKSSILECGLLKVRFAPDSDRIAGGRTLSAALCLLKLEDTLPIVFHANQCPVALLRCI